MAAAAPSTERQLELFSFLLKLRTRDLLTVREAAEALRISDSAVRQLMELHELRGPRYALGGESFKTPRITVVSLIAYLVKSFEEFDAAEYDELLAIFAEKLRTRRACDRMVELITRQRSRLP